MDKLVSMTAFPLPGSVATRSGSQIQSGCRASEAVVAGAIVLSLELPGC